MAPKLKDDLLAEYPGMPADEGVQQYWPLLAEDLHNFATQVPEFGVWKDEFETPDGKVHQLITEPTKRAVAQILGLFYRDLDEKKEYSPAQIKKNIAMMIISIRARLAQLENNREWLDRRTDFEQKAGIWVAKEREAVLDGKKPLNYYPKVAFPPFISSTDQGFARSPLNFAKMVQDRMTDNTNRFVVAGDLEDEKHRAAVQELILDPRHISDRQVELFGIDTPWSTRRVSAREKMEFKASILDRVKSVWRGLRRIDKKDTNHRDHFGRHRLYATPEGNVLGTTNINSAIPTFFVSTLRDATRRGPHIAKGTAQESRELYKLLATIVSFDQTLGKGWTQVSNNEQLSVARNLVAAELKGKNNVLNKDKKAAWALLEQVMDLDSTYTRTVKKRGQPAQEVKIHIPYTAKRAQVRAAIGHIEKRLDGAGRHIPRYNANDMIVLAEETGRNEAVPFARLLEYLEDKDKGRNPIMDSRRMSPAQRERVIGTLKQWEAQFNHKKRNPPLLAPYHSFAVAVAAELQTAIALVESPEATIGSFKDSLDSLRNYLLLHRTWETWENLYDTHLGNDRLPFFKHFIRDMGQLINSLPQNPPELESVEPAAAALQSYRQQAGTIIGTCRQGIEALSSPGGEKLADKVRIELKKQMRELNIRELLQKPEPLSESPSEFPLSEESMDEPPISEFPQEEK